MKSKVYFILVIFCVAGLAPMAVSAEVLPSALAAEIDTGSSFAVCGILTKALDKLEQPPFKFDFISSHFQTATEDRGIERLAVDNLKKSLRQKEDTDIILHFERLSEMAKNQAEHDAVTEYKKMVLAAVKEKRAETDVVIEKYRNEMDKLEEVKLSRASADLSIFDRLLIYRLRSMIKDCEENPEGLNIEKIIERISEIRNSDILEEVFDFSSVEWAIQQRRDKALSAIEEKFKVDIKSASETLRINN